jgi:hypothetical protein
MITIEDEHSRNENLVTLMERTVIGQNRRRETGVIRMKPYAAGIIPQNATSIVICRIRRKTITQRYYVIGNNVCNVVAVIEIVFFQPAVNKNGIAGNERFEVFEPVSNDGIREIVRPE